LPGFPAQNQGREFYPQGQKAGVDYRKITPALTGASSRLENIVILWKRTPS